MTIPYARFLLWFCLLCLAGCSTLTPTPPAKVWQEPSSVRPGSYRLQFFLDGRETLPAYLAGEKAKNPELAPFEVEGLLRLFRQAYAPLYLPVQPGVPFCHLETNFRHCRGIELQSDFEIFEDTTVVLHSRILYHVRLRLEGDQPNFFRSAKAQRDRGEFALPRRYYVGSLVEDLQKALPILQEIARDYRKYIKNDAQEIEIELTLEESAPRAAAERTNKRLEEGAHFSGKALLSVLPNISLLAGMTVSALHTGGRTFWDVLKEEKEFTLCREQLDLEEVEFSYVESVKRHLARILPGEEPSDILLREIVVRLRPKEPDVPGPT